LRREKWGKKEKPSLDACVISYLRGKKPLGGGSLFTRGGEKRKERGGVRTAEGGLLASVLHKFSREQEVTGRGRVKTLGPESGRARGALSTRRQLNVSLMGSVAGLRNRFAANWIGALAIKEQKAPKEITG